MEKVKICNVDNGIPNFNKSFEVMFNPNEININEQCKQKYTENNRKKAKREDEVTLSSTLFFNTYDNMWQSEYSDVRKEIAKFDVFQNQKVAAQKDYKEICFSWGSICVVGILASFSVNYTMFTTDGTPVRADVSITIMGRYYGNEDFSKKSKPDFQFESEVLNQAVNVKESLRKGLLI